jgi:hypothetical protein
VIRLTVMGHTLLSDYGHHVFTRTLRLQWDLLVAMFGWLDVVGRAVMAPTSRAACTCMVPASSAVGKHG